MTCHPFSAVKVGGRSRAVEPAGKFDDLKAMTDWVSQRYSAELNIDKLNTDEPAGITSDGGLIFLYGRTA